MTVTAPICQECDHPIHPAVPQRYVQAGVCGAQCWDALHGAVHEPEPDDEPGSEW